MSDRPLLMIPGPVELSPGVAAAAARPPPSHVSPELIAAFGESIRGLREIFGCGPEGVPLVLAGSGTLAMEAAATNLLGPGRTALVVSTGYFGDRMAEIIRRTGAAAETLSVTPGALPEPAAVEAKLEQLRPFALFFTHVDTSTGVRVDAQALAALGRRHGALVVSDGVCATGGEPLIAHEAGVDVHLTASQKALGLPPGLALLSFSPRALEARRTRQGLPPLFLDVESWRPIHEAYEQGRPSYFATPATSLIFALREGVRELLSARHGALTGLPAVWARHARAARAIRAALQVAGLSFVPTEPSAWASTLTAPLLPPGVPPTLPATIARHGVLVAGGLHPAIRERYFRIGHMGWAATQPLLLRRTVVAVLEGLAAHGHRSDGPAALVALERAWDEG